MLWHVDARLCRFPLEGVVTVLLSMPGLQVKILVCLVGLDSGDALHYSLGGVAMDLRRCRSSRLGLFRPSYDFVWQRLRVVFVHLSIFLRCHFYCFNFFDLLVMSPSSLSCTI